MSEQPSSTAYESLTEPQRYVLETLVNGNGHFVNADPVEYSCDDGSHDTGEPRSCNCRAGWHAEDVAWDSREPLLWGMNLMATRNLIANGLLVWDQQRQRGWITNEARSAFAKTNPVYSPDGPVAKVVGCGDHADEWVRSCDECWEAVKECASGLVDLAADELNGATV